MLCTPKLFASDLCDDVVSIRILMAPDEFQMVDGETDVVQQVQMQRMIRFKSGNVNPSINPLDPFPL